jgi:pimeloyl-ACP methyl ester carboxylesterase
MELFHETYGSGPPVVFLPGFGATTYLWRDVIPSLSGGNQLVLVDLKGFGRSPKPRDGRYTVYDQADLVAQFLDSHNLRGVRLVGHSFGAGVALVVALRRPDLVSALILMDATAYDEPVPLLVRLLRVPAIGPLLQHALPTRFQVRWVLKRGYYDDRKITGEEVTIYAASLSSENGRYAIRETLRHVPPPDIDSLTAQYPTIKVPTLIIWGRHDEIVPLASGERLHRAIAQSQLVIIEDAGHVSIEEQPRPVLEAVTEFLKKQPGGP